LNFDLTPNAEPQKKSGLEAFSRRVLRFCGSVLGLGTRERPQIKIRNSKLLQGGYSGINPVN
jgi:hypothetical protein